MIKKKLLNFRIKYFNKKKQSYRCSKSYSNASQIAVLYTDPHASIGLIEQLLQRLSTDNKDVCVVRFLSSPLITEQAQDVYTPKDFTFLGQVKNKQLKRHITTSFDYLLCLDETPSLYVKYFLAASHALCRAGFYQEYLHPYFELMIKSDQPQQNWLDDLYTYIKKI